MKLGNKRHVDDSKNQQYKAPKFNWTELIKNFQEWDERKQIEKGGGYGIIE